MYIRVYIYVYAYARVLLTFIGDIGHVTNRVQSVHIYEI